MSSSSNQDSGDPDNRGRKGAVGRPLPEGILLLNRQRVARPDWDEVRRFVVRLFTEVAPSGFTVCLLSDQGIREYNRRFRSTDRPTDVLSFPSEERNNGHAAYLGDILISVETARDNAKCYGLRLEEEIRVLALHGLLHLLGYDHERDRGEMARLERRWSRRLGLPQSLTGRARPRRAAHKGANRSSR